MREEGGREGGTISIPLVVFNCMTFCLIGTYVLIISEVTQPPFLSQRLEDLYVELTVVSQKVSAHKPGEASIEKLLQSSRKGKGSSLDVLRMQKSKSKTPLLVHSKIKE